MFFRRLNGFEVDYPASLTPHSGVAGLNRNARPVWFGMGGRFASEYALPGLFIYSLYQRNIMDRKTALKWLEDLSNFISEDEYSMTRFLLEGKS
jgi:hypothetical protein